MIHSPHTYSLLILLTGLIIISSLLLKAGLRRLHIPGLVGFIALGFILRLLDMQWKILSGEAESVFFFLGQVGVVALLFRIGLESNLQGLVRQLPRAGWIWIGNVALSGIGVYAVARWLLQLNPVTAVFAAVSLTATSVGVSVAVWQQKNALKSDNGELLLDVAELDDISGIALMAVLFAVVPVLQQGDLSLAVLPKIAQSAGWFILKLIGFAAGCFLFSRYLEERLTELFKKAGHPETTMLLVAGTGFVIAAVAGWLGFSLAIGALFAGLLFSRDPDAVKLDTSFESTYELFTPFFFISIGLNINPASLQQGFVIGSVLLLPAVLFKLLGAGLPALLNTRRSGALLIGLSMVPRAEIALIIAQRGKQLGDWAVSPSLFSGIIFVCAVTSLLVPWGLFFLLEKVPPSGKRT